MDSRSLFLTANTTVNYVWGWLDLKEGPVVVESPHGVLGLVDIFPSSTSPTLAKRAPIREKAVSSCSCLPATKARPRTATSSTSAFVNAIVVQDHMNAGRIGIVFSHQRPELSKRHLGPNRN